MLFKTYLRRIAQFQHMIKHTVIIYFIGIFKRELKNKTICLYFQIKLRTPID